MFIAFSHLFNLWGYFSDGNISADALQVNSKHNFSAAEEQIT
jgi:hypothetical protein